MMRAADGCLDVIEYRNSLSRPRTAALPLLPRQMEAPESFWEPCLPAVAKASQPHTFSPFGRLLA